MKHFLNLMLFLLSTAFLAVGLEQQLDIAPVYTFGGAFGGAVLLGVVSPFMPAGIMRMGLLTELWIGELIKHFRHSNTFLSRIANKNNMVNKNAIHFADIGVDPNVLVNNTTYPIPSAQRTDSDIVIALDKFDTENTIITDDELYALPYDKPGSVLNQHRETLEEFTAEKSAHSLCPDEDTATTPVVLTTGASNGYTAARKRLTINDVIKAQRLLDDLKIPAEGRELVLCPLHVEDLLLTSQVFKEQYSKIKPGEVLDMYGFKVSKFVANPLFSNSNGKKKAFGAAANAATDLATSLFYYNRRAVQARGSVSMYKAEAKNDPKYRQSEVGFRMYHICLPKKWDGFGAIVSSVV